MQATKFHSFSIYYIIALSIIAILSITSHIILSYTLGKHEGLAGLINISGRQRMYSQRIASLSAQYMLGNHSVKNALVNTVDAFEKAHETLSRSSTVDENGNSNAKALYMLYFRGRHNLSVLVNDYVQSAEEITSNTTTRAEKTKTLAHIFQESHERLLTKLDKVVAIYQSESERRLKILDIVQWVILAIVLITLSLEAAFIFRPMILRMKIFTEQLFKLATTDPLTMVFNRRHFMQSCESTLRNKRYQKSPISLMMIDADHFKKVNDTFGHQVGDRILVAMTQQMRNMMRENDIIGRLGGEEFAILLPDVSTNDAQKIALRLKDKIAAEKIETELGEASVTVSIGITNASEVYLDYALTIADKALYTAKESGRNTVFVL